MMGDTMRAAMGDRVLRIGDCASCIFFEASAQRELCGITEETLDPLDADPPDSCPLRTHPVTLVVNDD